VALGCDRRRRVSRLRTAGRCGVLGRDLQARAQLAGAVDHDALAGVQALLDFHHAGAACTGDHIHALDAFIGLDAVNEGIAANLHHGDFRHHQRRALALGAGLPDRPERLREAIVAQVRRYVDVHLSDPALTPPRIAAAHAISVRTLHEAFEVTGESVGALVRRRRLERCHTDLCAGAGDTVSQIALRWGFRDSSHFSRLFRRHFGVSPRELQAAHARSTTAR